MHVPARVVTNADLERLMDTSDAWIVERTGIRERRWVEPGTGATDLALEATRLALADARREAADVDFILFASTTRDYFFPGCGPLLQERLGIGTVAAMDVHNACSGFVYSLATADALVRTGEYRCVLVVGAEVQSTGLNLSTAGRDMAVLFGDGAGAAVLEPSLDKTRGLLASALHAEGAHAKTRFAEVIGEALARAGHTLDQVALIVPHQANQRIGDAVAERLGLPAEKVFQNIQRYGNTTAASIPIALTEARAEGRMKPGDLVVLAAFGGGFAWGATVMRW